MAVKTCCFWFDIKTGGLIMGYSTLVVRGMILLCLIFSVITSLVLTTSWTTLRLESRPYQSSQNNYISSVAFTQNNSFYILLPLIGIYAIATITSVCLIFGINRRRVNLILPYLIFDTVLTLNVSALWFLVIVTLQESIFLL